jgi:cytochrome c biogenesis protein CcdA
VTGLLALAFTAGMIAPVNPCGFALLPAWIAYALGAADTAPLPVRTGRALRCGVALTLGFAGTLTAAGLLVSAGARALIQTAPWLGLATGVILLLLGLATLTGRSPALRLPVPRPTVAGPPTARRMVVFGIGYAAASLSCTFGVLLAVIAQAQTTTSDAGLLLVFAVYAAGSATVLLLIALTTAAAGTALTTAAVGTALTRRITALARYSPRLAAAVLALTGAYLAWYWYPAATAHAGTAGRSDGLTRFSTTLSTWLQAHTATVAALTATVVLAAGALALRHRLRPQPTAQFTAEADHHSPPPPVPAAAPTDQRQGPGSHCC